MLLRDVDAYFRQHLQIDALAGLDASLNGIQVDRRNQEIDTVAFAVDACMDSFRRAVEGGAGLLFVHHGLYFGRIKPVTGHYYERLRYLFEHDLALYAAHLPLDQHPEFGNNAGMAAALGLLDVEPFGEYKGVTIGYKGRLPEARTLQQIQAVIGSGPPMGVLPFGPDQISTVGIVSGGAPYDVSQAIEQGLDCYITGDASHSIYHEALESRINVIFGGHYQTEVWGVKLLAQRTAVDTGLNTFFVDVPTGL